MKYKSGDFKGAISEYDGAIRLDGNLAEAYRDRGMAKMGQRIFRGRSGTAIKRYVSTRRTPGRLTCAAWHDTF